MITRLYIPQIFFSENFYIFFIQPNYAYVFNAKKLKVKSGDSGKFSLRLLINWSFLNTVLYLLFESQIYMDLWIFIQTGKFHQITGPHRKTIISPCIIQKESKVQRKKKKLQIIKIMEVYRVKKIKTCKLEGFEG